MKKSWVLLIGLLLMWSCEKGIENSPSDNNGNVVRDIKLISSVNNGDGRYSYKVLLPTALEDKSQVWNQVGYQINGEGDILTNLSPEPNGLDAYLWEFTTANADVYLDYGRCQNEPPDKIKWAITANLSPETTGYFVEKDGRKTIGIIFRDGKITPMIPASLVTLQAIIKVGPTEALTGANITLDGRNSTAQGSPKSQIIKYYWDFGDGTNAEGSTAVHSYQLSGTYTISLTVSDDLGNTNTAQTVVKITEMAHPGEFGDDNIRFSFDYQNNLLIVYFNFKKCQGNMLGKPNVYGNFNGPDVAWRLYYTEGELKFDSHHVGWGYLELLMTQPIMAIKCGYSAWFDGTSDNPNFSRSNFDHMKSSYYYNGQDLSFVYYSSGQIVKGP